MDKHQVKKNKTLLTYMQTIESESKFKAKVSYTLSCLNSYLQASPSSQYQENIRTLSQFHNKLIQIAHMHPDWNILATITFLFCKFEKFGIRNYSQRFLQSLLNIDAQGQVTQQFVQSLGTLLLLLKHRYRKIKQICIQFLFNNKIKIKQHLCMKIIKYMINLSIITLQQCFKLSQVQYAPPQIILQLMMCIVISNPPSQPQIQRIDKILNKYVDIFWKSEQIVYLCLCVAILCSLYASQQIGTNNLQIKSVYLNNYFYNNPKPFYLTYTDKPNLLNFNNLFKDIIKHYSIQVGYLCSQNNVNSNNSTISIIKTIQSIIPKIQSNSQQYQLLCAIIQRSKIPVNLLTKYNQIIPLQAISSTNFLNMEQMFAKLNKQYGQNKDNVRVCFVALYKLWELFNIRTTQTFFDPKQIQMFYRFLLPLLQIYLLNKFRKYFKSVQQLVRIVLKKTFSLIPNTFTLFSKLISENLNFALFLPIMIQLQLFQVFPEKQRQKFIKNIQNFISSENIPIQLQFYCCNILIKYDKKTYLNSIKKFVYFLLRRLGADRQPFEQISYYLRNIQWTQQQIYWIQQNFQQQMQRFLQKIFSRLPDIQFKAPKSIIYALQKFNIFSQWRSVHRWALNPLDQPTYSNSECLIDSLQVFETIVEDCKKVPIQVIKRFFSTVAKHWQRFNHHHMFTIQRISRFLFSEQQLSPQALQQLTWFLKSLTSRNWENRTNNQLYKQSLSVMIKNTLMEETSQLDVTLQKLIFNQILSISFDSQPSSKPDQNLGNYNYLQTKIFSQQLLMWRFQYQQVPIIDKVAEIFVKLINNYPKIQKQITNPKDLQLLIQNSLQIISSVAHNCNLLQLNLAKILTTYIRNHNIIQFIIQIVCNVKEINMKAIAKYKFDKAISAIFCRMLVEVSDRDGENIDSKYVQFLEEICGDQLSPYNSLPIKNTQLMKQIIRSQCVFVTNRYRPQIVKYILQQISQLGKKTIIPKKWIQIIWLKYFDNEEIKQICYGYFAQLKQRQKQMDSKNITVTILKEIQNEGKKDKQVKKDQTKAIISSENNKQQVNHKQKDIIKKEQQQGKKNENSNKIDFIENKNKQKSFKPLIEEQQKQEPNDKVQNQNSVKAPSMRSPKKTGFNLQISQTSGQKNFQTFQQPKMSNKQKENPFSNKTSKTNNNNKTDSGLKKKRTTKNNQQQIQNINNIKSYISYIGSLADIEADQSQITKLQEALDYIIDVVVIHQYYCQKVINFGVINKCLALHPNTQKKVVQKIIQLFLEVSDNKQKNSLVFNDAKSIDFFKTLLKQSINIRKQVQTTHHIIKILQKCWSSSNDFFAHGLLSMLFQMSKIDLNRQQTLSMLSKCQLSYSIVNQIYQRGLFNIMQNTLQIPNNKLTEKDKNQICLWARLMGKVCLNLSIREKMYSMKLHTLSYDKIFIFTEKNCVQNLAFLYASFTYQYEKISIWCIQKKIPQFFLSQIQTYEEFIPTEYYKFFRYFSQNGEIKFHTHLLSILNKVKTKIKNQGFKHYYKCLAHLFTPKYYQIFVKQKLIESLVNNYIDGHNCHILQCLQKLVSQFQQKKELDALQKQNFYEIQCVFNSKVKDDLSYPYILQIYLNLLLKFRKFDANHLNLDLANKILRKGIYSINMQGKKKVIQFLIQLSEIDKICYGNANCLNIFQSIFGYSVGLQELNLLIKYAKIQFKFQFPQRKNEQEKLQQQQKYPLRFKYMTKVKAQNFIQILLNKVDELNNDNLNQNIDNKKCKNKIAEALSYFLMNLQNCVYIFDKLGLSLFKTKNNSFGYEQNVKLLNRILYWKQIQGRFQKFSHQIYQYLESAINYYTQNKQIDQQKVQIFVDLLEKCLKNNIVQQKLLQKLCNEYFQKNNKIKSIQKVKKFMKLCREYQNFEQITETMKSAMKAGVKVKMYKNDGSNSSLLLFFTEDLFQLNCATSVGQLVKNKWKLGLNQIISVQQFSSEQVFKASVFYLSSGIFTKPPQSQNCLIVNGKSKNFYICFENTAQLLQWKKFIQIGKSRALQLTSKVQ